MIYRANIFDTKSEKLYRSKYTTFKALITLFLLLFSPHLFAATLPLDDAQKAYIAQKKSVTMCVDPDWEPFEVLNKNGRHIGIAADLIRLVAQRVGLVIVPLQTKDWDESVALSKAGKCDILSFVNQTPQREEWLIFTSPLLEDRNVFVAKRGHPRIDELDDLEEGLIVLPSGSSILERVSKRYKNLDILSVSSEKDVFDALEEERADLTLRSLITSAHTIRKEGYFNLEIIGYADDAYTNFLRMGVLKSEPMLRDILDIGVKSITKDERDEIINRHVNIQIENSYFRILLVVIASVLLLAILGIAHSRYLQRRIDQEVAKNREQQEYLFEIEKKAELGSMVGNIAHQWREGITKIGYKNLKTLSYIESGKEIETKELLECSRDIEETLSFMSLTMQTFLDYYKPSQDIEEFNIYKSIQDAIFIIDSSIQGSRLKIEIEGEKDTLQKGKKNEFMQIWISLIGNSTKAAIEKKIEKPYLKIVIKEDSILFCDNCKGIPKDVLDALKSGRSCGLGLKICKSIAQKYGKKLEIRSDEKGSCFTIS